MRNPEQRRRERERESQTLLEKILGLKFEMKNERLLQLMISKREKEKEREKK